MAEDKGRNIPETGEATPTKIAVHACDINPYSHEPILFFEPGGHVHGNFGRFEGKAKRKKISKTGEAMTSKLCVHVHLMVLMTSGTLRDSYCKTCNCFYVYKELN